ncbi:hypothetical protein NDU88_003258 [Pleurodeles waltl]|uniref:Uncharacterized protein n=1 Tax=Pleurodeles waltl TaxID=8319 RepID=A0AAV7WSC2_PLEWA|nr:hypothetical protein NDU88_003258 [Pleurodeles waltl]
MAGTLRALRLPCCSRELKSPTTSDIKPGAERRSTDPCGLENNVIGNPDGRIPENIPARRRDWEMITEAGNPDIRVPDSVKIDDGIRALRELKTRDADVGEMGRGKGKKTVHGQTPTEEQTNTDPEDTAMGQEGPKELERRHVPRETWTVASQNQTALDSGKTYEHTYLDQKCISSLYLGQDV